jgi:hypothetical protein
VELVIAHEVVIADLELLVEEILVVERGVTAGPCWSRWSTSSGTLPSIAIWKSKMLSGRDEFVSRKSEYLNDRRLLSLMTQLPSRTPILRVDSDPAEVVPAENSPPTLAPTVSVLESR